MPPASVRNQAPAAGETPALPGLGLLVGKESGSIPVVSACILLIGERQGEGES